MKKFFYRVHGEGVLDISNRFNIPPLKLIYDNSLYGELSDGDIIFIEAEDCDCSLYCVQPFDTVDKIVERFKLDKARFLAENGNPPYLFCGMRVKI